LDLGGGKKRANSQEEDIQKKADKNHSHQNLGEKASAKEGEEVGEEGFLLFGAKGSDRIKDDL